MPVSRPNVMRVSTKPSLTVMTCTPALKSRLRSPCRVQAERALRTAVDVVALPAAVAGHRGDAHDGAARAGAHVRRQPLADGHRRGVVHVDDLVCGLEVGFARLLVAHVAEREHGDFDGADGGDDRLEKRRVTVEIRGVEAARGADALCADAHVGSDGGGFFGVPGGDEDRLPVLGVAVGEALRDARGGPENEHAHG
jgi:hypothetical protein